MSKGFNWVASKTENPCWLRTDGPDLWLGLAMRIRGVGVRKDGQRCGKQFAGYPLQRLQPLVYPAFSL